MLPPALRSVFPVLSAASTTQFWDIYEISLLLSIRGLITFSDDHPFLARNQEIKNQKAKLLQDQERTLTP